MELVALLPALMAVAVAVFCVLAAERARELTGHAAEAGAVAMLQERDAAQAAREAIPGHAAHEARILVRGRTVTVTVRPRLPLHRLAGWLSASERADAGPEARP